MAKLSAKEKKREWIIGETQVNEGAPGTTKRTKETNKATRILGRVYGVAASLSCVVRYQLNPSDGAFLISATCVSVCVRARGRVCVSFIFVCFCKGVEAIHPSNFVANRNCIVSEGLFVCLGEDTMRLGGGEGNLWRAGEEWA